MRETPGWADFIAEMGRARQEAVDALVAGHPNRYGERGDDEKRAMIHAITTIMKFPEAVERAAERAKVAVKRMEDLHASMVADRDIHETFQL